MNTQLSTLLSAKGWGVAGEGFYLVAILDVACFDSASLGWRDGWPETPFRRSVIT